MNIDNNHVISANEVQSVVAAVDSGLGERVSQTIEEAHMSHAAAEVRGVQSQGMNVQIKAWVASLPLSKKQTMELLRLKRDDDGVQRDSNITKDIKQNILIEKVAGTVERLRQGIVVQPTREPFNWQSPSPSDEFKLRIDLPEKSDWSAPKP